MIKIWKEHFSELLNGMNENEDKEVEVQDVEQREECSEEPPNIMEIEEIITSLKNNKSPGNDQLTAELFKYGGRKLVEWMQVILEKVWKQERLPKDWNEAILVPIYKKGNKMECSNYRGIALLNVAYKIFATHLKRKITTKIEEEIGEYQCGFRKGRSVIDQIFTLREIQAENYEYGKETYVLFIDFRQAYDTLKRTELHQALNELGIKGKLARLIKTTLTNTNNSVRVGHDTSSKFAVSDGVRQGDPLSSVLFNSALEVIVRRAGLHRNGLINHKKHQCLAFADDLVIVTRNKRELQDCIFKLEEEAQRMGLHINETKTKYMTWTDKDYKKGSKLEITNGSGKMYSFEEVERYAYLGTEFCRRPGYREEMQSRLMKANKCMQGTRGILYNKNISRGLKIKLYKTVIRPVAIYGSEAWTLGATEQRMMAVWERKILRKIYGGKKCEDRWERRNNMELYELFKEPNIVAIMKGRRLSWLGHITRMDNTRTPKRIIESNIGGRRRRGRPKARWRQEVTRDLEEAEIRGWKEKALNRKTWKGAVKQAVGLLGLKC